jgi:hypothetical protein
MSLNNVAVRAGIRDSSGDGANGGSTNQPPTANPMIPDLSPKPKDIIELLAGKSIVQKKDKKAIFFNAGKTPFSAYLNSINPTEGAKVDAIWATVRRTSNIAAEELARLIYSIYEATITICPSSIHYAGLSAEQKQCISILHSYVTSAEKEASTTLNGRFSSLFITRSKLPEGEYNCPYLMNGYVPICLECGTCICCLHPFTDEPNSNQIANTNNTHKKAAHLSQLATDQQAWDAGVKVLTSRGGKMAPNRKRNEPKYELLIYHCHCHQFGCTTSVGNVSERECPKKCIDAETGQWYTIDQVTGLCTCPICACNACPSFYAVSSECLAIQFCKSHYTDAL